MSLNELHSHIAVQSDMTLPFYVFTGFKTSSCVGFQIPSPVDLLDSVISVCPGTFNPSHSLSKSLSLIICRLSTHFSFKSFPLSLAFNYPVVRVAVELQVWVLHGSCFPKDCCVVSDPSLVTFLGTARPSSQQSLDDALSTAPVLFSNGFRRTSHSVKQSGCSTWNPSVHLDHCQIRVVF